MIDISINILWCPTLNSASIGILITLKCNFTNQPTFNRKNNNFLLHKIQFSRNYPSVWFPHTNVTVENTPLLKRMDEGFSYFVSWLDGLLLQGASHIDVNIHVHHPIVHVYYLKHCMAPRFLYIQAT